MDGAMASGRMRRRLFIMDVSRIVFYGLKLPAMLVLIVCGLMLEFLVQLPFLICFYIDGCFKNKTGMRRLDRT
jgi:hypothetical protein